MSEDRIVAVEAHLGFRLPEPLRRLYRDVANGGFGPGYGLYALDRAQAVDDDRSLVEAYEMFLEDETWPRDLLPIVDWGCALWSCVDCATPAAQIVNVTIPTIVETDQGLDDWLQAWLAGVKLEEEMFEPCRESKPGRNPFTGAPLALVMPGKLRGRPRLRRVASPGRPHTT